MDPLSWWQKARAAAANVIKDLEDELWEASMNSSSTDNNQQSSSPAGGKRGVPSSSSASVSGTSQEELNQSPPSHMAPPDAKQAEQYRLEMERDRERVEHDLNQLRAHSGWAKEAVGAALQTIPKAPPAESKSRIWRREFAFACSSHAMVPGTLSFSDTFITFEPDPRSLAVKRAGVGAYQMLIPIASISEAAAIVLPRTKSVENLFSLPATDSKFKETPAWTNLDKCSADSGSSPTSSSGASFGRPNIDTTCIGLLQIVLRRTNLVKGLKKSPISKGSRGVTPRPPSISSQSLAGSTDLLIAPSSSTSKKGKGISHSHPPGHTEGNPGGNGNAPKPPPTCPGAPPAHGGHSAQESGSGQSKLQDPPAPADGFSGRAPRKPRSFIAFRLQSASVVKEVARTLLDTVDAYAESHAHELSEVSTPASASAALGGPVAFVPFLSNAVLDVLLQMCSESDGYASDEHGADYTGGEAMPKPADKSTCLPEPKSKLAEWIMRPSPPAMEPLSGAISLITDDMACQLAASLPPTVALRKWVMLFDTSCHGVSMLSFFNKVEGSAPGILVIRDSKGFVFGGYSSEGFINSRHYYGTGETLVFTFGYVPMHAHNTKLDSRKTTQAGYAPHSSENQEEGGGHPPHNSRSEGLHRVSSSSAEEDIHDSSVNLRVFLWSGRNSYFVYTDPNRIMFGGGGQYAFALDQNLLQGQAGLCPTFSNSLLAGNEDFAAAHVQVWGFERLDL